MLRERVGLEVFVIDCLGWEKDCEVVRKEGRMSGRG